MYIKGFIIAYDIGYDTHTVHTVFWGGWYRDRPLYLIVPKQLNILNSILFKLGLLCNHSNVVQCRALPCLIPLRPASRQHGLGFSSWLLLLCNHTQCWISSIQQQKCCACKKKTELSMLWTHLFLSNETCRISAKTSTSVCFSELCVSTKAPLHLTADFSLTRENPSRSGNARPPARSLARSREAQGL